MTKTNTQFFDDLSRMASGAFSQALETGRSLENLLQEQFAEFASKGGLVKREEFEALQEEVRNLRKKNDELEAKLSAQGADAAL